MSFLEQERAQESARLFSDLREELRAARCRVECVGISGDVISGNRGINVYVRSKDDADKVPQQYAGLPVKTFVVGRIVPAT